MTEQIVNVIGAGLAGERGRMANRQTWRKGTTL